MINQDFGKKPEKEEENNNLNETLTAVYPPAFPLVMKTFRSSIETLDNHPHSAEAWASVAITSNLFAGCTEKSETQVWREALIRSLVSSEIAISLAPDDPIIRLIHEMTLLSSGRIADAIKKGETFIQEHPDEEIMKAFVKALWGKTKRGQQD